MDNLKIASGSSGFQSWEGPEIKLSTWLHRSRHYGHIFAKADWLCLPQKIGGSWMASRQSTVDFLLEQIGGAGAVSAKKMFGEYGVYCDGVMVALVCDDQLFVKPTDAGKAFAGDLDEGCPYPGAKPCVLVPGEKWDDREWLTQLIKLSADALSSPKKRKPGGKSRS